MSKRLDPVDGHQRSLDQLLVHLVREVGLEAAAVEVELAGAGHQTHPHHGLLAAADGLDGAVDHDRLARRAPLDASATVSTLPPRRLGLLGSPRGLGLSSASASTASVASVGLGHWVTCLISYGTGCWAAWGCSGPA